MKSTTKRFQFAFSLASALLFLFFAFIPFAKAAENNSAIAGVVQDASGKPVTGAFVKLKNNDRHLEFLVISQAQGHYTASNLPSGQYVVQSIGAGYQSAVSDPVDVADGKTAKLDLALTTKQGPALPRAWPMRTPQALLGSIPADLPDGPGKKLVSTRCTTCHDTARIMSLHMDRDRWAHTVNGMRANMRAAKVRELTDDEAQEAVDYLAAMFPPIGAQDLNSRLPRSLLEGKALHYRVVQYDVSDTNRDAEPHDVALDPHGNGWVGERVGKLGRLDPKTLEFTEVPIPPGRASAESQRLGNPQIDAKGQMWLPDGPNGRWLNYDINTGKFTIYDWPKDMKGAAGGNTMLIHPNGTIWETSGNEVRMLNPATKEFKAFPSPIFLETKVPSGSYGMTVAGDGKVWWAEDAADRMAKVDPMTGKTEEFKIPFDGVAFPRRMTHDARGDIWVGLWNAGRLLKIDYETNQMTMYAPPTETPGTYSVSVDKKNNLVWVSEQQADKIARFNPKTGEWTEFPLPDSESDPRKIEVDQNNPNRVWWSGDTSARVGFVEVLSAN